MSDSFESDEPSFGASDSADSGKGSEANDLAGGDKTCYDLPPKVNHLLKKHRHIEKLYDWQDRLMNQLLEDNKNVIYCVPTSGGKTLVAELMLLREMLHNHRDAILVLPFISIVQEKLRALRPFAESLGFAIEEYSGSRGAVPVKKRGKMRTLFLATIEKANVVVTSLFELGRLNEIGLFVVDELHMIGDGSARGATLETLIVKTKLAAAKSGASMRFLGMSATLTNFNHLCRFMDAELIKNNFRPVELKELLKFENYVYDASGISRGHEYEHMPMVRTLPEVKGNADPEHLCTLVGEVIPKKSVLLFCPTKKHCEDTAGMLCRELPNKQLLLQYKKTEKERLVKCILQSNSGGICKVLNKTIPFGIAYHHSGLTPDERQMIEEAFSKNVISCIVCTSTLAAGVNLPAERVIIRSPYVGRDFICKSQYQQMCGRAGRAGLCSFGESILIGSAKDSRRIRELIEAPLPECRSSLKDVKNGLTAFILTLLKLQLADTREGLETIITTHTLSGIQYLKAELVPKISIALNQLLSSSLIRFDKETKTFHVSDVGNGVVRGLVDVERSQAILEEMKKAQAAMSLSDYLHLIYLTTQLIDEKELPYAVNCELFMDAYDELTEKEQKSAETFGLSMGVVMSYKRPNAKLSPRIQRYFVTLVAYEVWNQRLRTDLSFVAKKYDPNGTSADPPANDFFDRYHMQRGTLYHMLAQVASAANALFRFSEEIKPLWPFRCLLPEVCNALTHCCAPELLPLMQLPELRIPRAWQLFRAGFKDIVSIAKLESYRELTDKIENLRRNQAEKLIQAAKHIIRCQKDELLQQVAEMKVPAVQEAEEADPAEDSFLLTFET